MTAFRIALAAAALAATAASAQEAKTTSEGAIEPVSGFTGRMSMTMPVAVPEDMAVTEEIRFEPWQMLDEMFRDDLVFVMRGGPTDWGQRDAPGTAPMECERQRLLTTDGDDGMRQLGALLVANDLRPGEIRVSEWCRTQQTYAAMERGMVMAHMDAMTGLGVDTFAELNLADDPADAAAALREMILAWDGGDGDGPLLLITHFPNIEAMTNFRVYEGEMLIVDPKRDGRVLGYLRLASATPDSVRFDPSVVIADVELVPRDDGG